MKDSYATALIIAAWIAGVLLGPSVCPPATDDDLDRYIYVSLSEAKSDGFADGVAWCMENHTTEDIEYDETVSMYPGIRGNFTIDDQGELSGTLEYPPRLKPGPITIVP